VEEAKLKVRRSWDKRCSHSISSIKNPILKFYELFLLLLKLCAAACAIFKINVVQKCHFGRFQTSWHGPPRPQHQLRRTMASTDRRKEIGTALPSNFAERSDGKRAEAAEHDLLGTAGNGCSLF
jgi:hypothetical protein